MIDIGKDENVPSLISKYTVLILQIGTQTCAAIKKRIDEWSKGRTQVAARYISLEERPDVAAEYGIFSVPAILVFVQGKLTDPTCSNPVNPDTQTY